MEREVDPIVTKKKKQRREMKMEESGKKEAKNPSLKRKEPAESTTNANRKKMTKEIAESIELETFMRKNIVK